MLKIFDKTVWLWRRIDGMLPWPGLSLIVVARNTAAAAGRRIRRARSAHGRFRRASRLMHPDIDAARLRAIAAEFSGKRILVVGDLMLDEFIWGKVSRISPEAPVPVVNVVSESYYPGGAANVARNVREFTGSSRDDGPDRGGSRTAARLLQLLEDCGIDTAGVQQDPVRARPR